MDLDHFARHACLFFDAKVVLGHSKQVVFLINDVMLAMVMDSVPTLRSSLNQRESGAWGGFVSRSVTLLLFSNLSEPERLAFASRAFRRDFEPGQNLFLEGEPCQGLYLIAEGAVKVYKSSSAGREVLLAIDEAPASIAEIPVFDGGNFPASAMAVRKVTVYFIPTQDFQQLCRENHDILLKLMTVVGKRLQALVAIVHQVTFGSVRQRLARALLDFGASQRSGSSLVLHDPDNQIVKLWLHRL